MTLNWPKYTQKFSNDDCHYYETYAEIDLVALRHAYTSFKKFLTTTADMF
jgi:hypothetical protein